MGREVFQQLECFKSCRLGFSISKDLCTTIAQTRDTQRKGPGHEMPLMLKGVKARAIGHDMPGLLQESLCVQSGVKAGLEAAQLALSFMERRLGVPYPLAKGGRQHHSLKFSMLFFNYCWWFKLTQVF